jgi:2-desacetyl-2-hydroxyethyl bacteriochlorophyllide A dehydrogenase
MAKTKYMRAAVVSGARQAGVCQLAIPKPAPAEVLIEVEGCGVCGSNLPLWQGRPWFRYPRPAGSPGHEGWGHIVALGTEVTTWRAGQRVAFLSDHAFAELDVADAGAVVALPAELAAADVPAEPLGCAFNVLRRSDIRADHTVAVVGVGFLGSLIVQLAARVGARVLALSQRACSLALANRVGAAATVCLAQEDDAVVDQVVELSGGRGCDRVVEAVGVQRTLDLAGRICAVRGRVVVAGFHQDGPRQVDVQLWNWRGLDIINAHEREPAAYVQGMRAAVDELASGRLRVAPLITHRVPLQEIRDAFELLCTRPDGFTKAVVVP